MNLAKSVRQTVMSRIASNNIPLYDDGEDRVWELIPPGSTVYDDDEMDELLLLMDPDTGRRVGAIEPGAMVISHTMERPLYAYVVGHYHGGAVTGWVKAAYLDWNPPCRD
jgi:hypothetical protein